MGFFTAFLLLRRPPEPRQRANNGDVEQRVWACQSPRPLKICADSCVRRADNSSGPAANDVHSPALRTRPMKLREPRSDCDHDRPAQPLVRLEEQLFVVMERIGALEEENARLREENWPLREENALR